LRPVERLQQDLREGDLPIRAREVVREEDLATADPVNGMTVFRTLPDGRCATWVWERGERILERTFDSEELAVAAWRERPVATPRAHEGAAPRTVEELKDALAEVGREPDDVARAEVLRDSPKPDGVRVLERQPDGTVRTYVLERGREADEATYPDEATAVAALADALLAGPPRPVTDKQVARMRVHAEQHRRLMAGLTRG
jgi:hypothetical protein